MQEAVAPAVEAAEKVAAPAVSIIGMDFLPFVYITVIAIIFSLIMRYAIKSRLIAGYPTELILAWLGAWLGSPVFGHWWKDVIEHEDVHFIPAIIGVFAALFLAKGVERFALRIWGKEEEAEEASAETAPPEPQA